MAATGENGISRRTLLGAGVGIAALGAAGPLRAVEVANLGARSVHVISDGGFALPASSLPKGVPAEEVAALLKAEGLPTGEAVSVLNVTLVKDGANWTIIDAGSGANFLPGSGKLAANLEAAGIDKDAVQTTGYSIHQEFDFPNGRRVPREYVARNGVEIRLDAVERTGELLDAVVESGATTVTGVRFDLRDRAGAEREALRQAVQDARLRAEALATGRAPDADRVDRLVAHLRGSA